MEAPLPALAARQVNSGIQTLGQPTLARPRQDCSRRFDHLYMPCRFHFWRWLGCLYRFDSGRHLLPDCPCLGLRALTRGKLDVMR